MRIFRNRTNRVTPYTAVVLTVLWLVSCGTARRIAFEADVKDDFPSATIPDGLYTPETSASYLYTEGIRHSLFPEGRTQSLQYFKQVLSIDSMHAPTYFEIAQLLADNPETAIPFSKQAVILDTANTWYMTQLGRLYISAEKYDSALTIYNRLLQIAPENPDNYRLLAALHEAQGQPFTAITILDSAETRFGKMPELSAFKRELLVNVRMFDQAIAEAKEITDNFPYDETNFVALAELYAATGKDSLAMDAYNKALAISPNSIGTVISLNEYYKNRGDNLNFLTTAKQLFASDEVPVDTKIRFFREITRSRQYYQDFFPLIANLASTLVAKYPGNPEVSNLYGEHLMTTGQVDEALELYKSIAQGPHATKTVYGYILDMEAFRNRPDSIEKYATLAIARFPDDADLYLRTGAAIGYFLKDYKRTEAEYKLALRYAPNDSVRSVIYGALGDNRHNMDDLTTTFKYYRKGLQCDPKNAVILNNYSYFLSLSDRQLEKAFAMAEQATALSPNNPTYLDTYAWALYKLGRYEEAKGVMRQAVSLDSTGSQELFLHYGDILYELREYTMAGFYWRKAREKGYDEEEIAKRMKQIE